MPNWDEVQVKAKMLISEGMELLKTGMHEAGFIAGTTANAAKLHANAGKHKIELYRTLHDLGQLLFDAIDESPMSGSINISDKMSELFGKASGLEKLVQKEEESLKKISVVKKKETPKRNV